MNPATAMWINAIITGLSGVATVVASSSQTGSSASVWAGLVATIIGGINTALHATSTSQPGPLRK